MKLTGNWLERFYALLLIGGVELGASFLMPFAPRSALYYPIAGAINAVTMVYITGIFNFTPLAFDLFKLELIQALCQLMGLLGALIFRSNFHVEIYNGGIALIVALTFLRILIVGPRDENPRSRGIRRVPALGGRLWNQFHQENSS